MSEEAVPLSIKGLTREEADAKLLAIGRNQLPEGSVRSLLKILLETFREPMFLLLVAAAALYLALGDLGEGLFLLAGACAAIGLVIFQDARSERALRALQDLSQPQVRVLRDELDFLIPAAELVPGDIMLAGKDGCRMRSGMAGYDMALCAIGECLPNCQTGTTFAVPAPVEVIYRMRRLEA